MEVGDFGASDDVTVNSVTPASGPSTTYTISITPNGIAFDLILAADSVMDTAASPNSGPANPASATGTATVAATNTAPVVSGNATPNYAENARRSSGDLHRDRCREQRLHPGQSLARMRVSLRLMRMAH